MGVLSPVGRLKGAHGILSLYRACAFSEGHSVIVVSRKRTTVALVLRFWRALSIYQCPLTFVAAPGAWLADPDDHAALYEATQGRAQLVRRAVELFGECCAFLCARLERVEDLDRPARPARIWLSAADPDGPGGIEGEAERGRGLPAALVALAVVEADGGLLLVVGLGAAGFNDAPGEVLDVHRSVGPRRGLAVGLLLADVGDAEHGHRQRAQGQERREGRVGVLGLGPGGGGERVGDDELNLLAGHLGAQGHDLIAERAPHRAVQERPVHGLGAEAAGEAPEPRRLLGPIALPIQIERAPDGGQPPPGTHGPIEEA